MSAFSANTVSFALGSHDVLALFPEASEPVAEAERGGAVVLRLRASMAAVARLTKPLLMYSSMKPLGNAQGVELEAASLVLLFALEKSALSVGSVACGATPRHSHRRRFGLNSHGACALARETWDNFELGTLIQKCRVMRLMAASYGAGIDRAQVATRSSDPTVLIPVSAYSKTSDGDAQCSP